MSNAVKRLLPLFNRVLIKKIQPEQSKAGIVIPESARPKPLMGRVLAVGPGSRITNGVKTIPCCIKVGDTVLLPDYGGTKVETEDKQEYLLYREGDILAKVTDK